MLSRAEQARLAVSSIGFGTLSSRMSSAVPCTLAAKIDSAANVPAETRAQSAFSKKDQKAVAFMTVVFYCGFDAFGQMR
jgi:hypothetical protein